MKKKEDVRVTKSKRDLKQALKNLLKEKNYSKITIMDICDKAIINRMTFYKHYNHKNDLLKELIKDEILNIRKIHNLVYPSVLLEEKPEVYVRNVIDIVITRFSVGEETKIISNLSNDLSSLSYLMNDIFYDAIYDIIERSKRVADSETTRVLLANYYSGGLTNILVKHILKQDENLKKDEILDFYEKQIVFLINNRSFKTQE